MSGVTFSTVAGEDFDLNGNNGIKISNFTGGADSSQSDLIQIWDPATSGYYTFYYYNEEGWEEDWAWYEQTDSCKPVLSIGTAFWYKAKAGDGKSIQTSGAVESDDDVTVNLTSGKFNMVINPYPVAVDLNSADAAVIANFTGGADSSQSDLIQIWDPATSGYYTFYYYNEEGWEEDWAWYEQTDSCKPIIPAGTAFWYKAKAGANKSITFKKTY